MTCWLRHYTTPHHTCDFNSSHILQLEQVRTSNPMVFLAALFAPPERASTINGSLARDCDIAATNSIDEWMITRGPVRVIIMANRRKNVNDTEFTFVLHGAHDALDTQHYIGSEVIGLV